MLLLIILSMELYFVGILPFPGGNVLFALFVLLFILLFLLYIFLLFVALPWAFFNKKKIKLALLPRLYGLRIVFGMLAWLVCMIVVVFQPYHRIMVVNKTNGFIDNITFKTSFTSNAEMLWHPILGVNKSTVFDLKNLENESPITLYRKIVINYTVDNKHKSVSKKSSFLRTKVVIRDHSKSNPKNISCKNSMSYKKINDKLVLVVNLNLCSKLLETYTINLIDFETSSDSYLIVNTPYDYKIKKAERVLYWYPSIWSKADSHLLQYTKLRDLQYQTSEDLIILSTEGAEKLQLGSNTYGNVIQYINHYNIDYELDIFKNITKNELNKNLKTELNRAKQGENPLTDVEKQEWMRYLNQYSKGDFLVDNRELFRVDCHDVYLKITFQGENGDYVRVLHKEIHIGN